MTLVLICAAACHDSTAHTSASSDSSGASTSAGTTTLATTTTSGADSTSTAGPEPVVVLDTTLELELKETIHVTVTTTGDAVEIAIDPSRAFGIVSGPLQGAGRIDAYPEADATVYVATFDGAAIGEGPCADAPVSLALALHHDHDADVIAGGLTGYCGAATFFGVPIVEPLRISGRVP
ncbi:MAG TPA: hypothetical protein VG755_32615 [Nannocystaceae bacterium]|nr:hypothetical protein [Nannocystaceae bacterium]